MLRLGANETPESINIKVFSYLSNFLTQMTGHPCEIVPSPTGLIEESFHSPDGYFYLKLPQIKYSKSAPSVRVSEEFLLDNTAKKILGKFKSVSRAFVKNTNQPWHIKAKIITEYDTFLDNIIVSLGYSGNQKYEILDIIQSIRESLLFKYEDSVVGNAILVTRNLHTIEKLMSDEGCTLIRLKHPFDVREEFRKNKMWHRLSHPDSILLVVSHDNRATHVALLPNQNDSYDSKEWEFVPGNIQKLRKYLVGRDLLLNATGKSEFFLASQKFVFRWNYMKWHRVSGSGLTELIVNEFTPEVSSKLIEVIKILSMNRQGGLLVLSDKPEQTLKGAKGGVNGFFANRRIFDIRNVKPEAIARFAAIDGALVLKKTGKVVNAGAILSIPIRTEKKLEGARTAAAIAASEHGMAIKVSQDGPVSIFKEGNLLRMLN